MARRRFVFSVVTHDSRAVLEPTLRSVVARLTPDDALIVIDNGSTDGSAELARAVAPGALVIEQANAGFGAGNNAAFRALESEFFVLVNPDVTLEQVDLARVAGYFASHPEVVALVGDVRNPDGTRQLVNRRFPTLGVLLARRLDLPLLRRIPALRRKLDRNELRDLDLDQPQRVPFGTGSFEIVRTGAITEPDLFDPRYFMYFEDVDLARRLWTRGETHYLPWLVITHRWTRASYRSWRSTWRHARSALQYFAKWGSFAPDGDDAT